MEWILPDIPAKMGEIRNVEFVRQEPKKRRLSDAHLSLDMPILFAFDQRQKNTDAQNELCTRREIGSDSIGIPAGHIAPAVQCPD